MKYRKLHDWALSPAEAVALQRELASRIRIEPYRGSPRLIAGADISYERFSDHFYAGFVVLDAKTLKIVDRVGAEADTLMPYIPGLLSFREIPALLEAWSLLETEPDVVFLDGQGIAHPRRMGIATHFGLVADVPAIGCGKSPLTGRFVPPGPEPGDWSPLLDRGETIGAVLRTKARTNPVFVSPGHRMDLPSAVRLTMSARGGYRIPEPTRQAHLFVNELRRSGPRTAKRAS